MFASGVAAALLIVALSAGSAWAAKPPLNLDEAGVPAATGAPAKLVVLIAGCEISTPGTITANGAAKDKAHAGTEAPASECFEGISSSGGLTEGQFAVKGSATLKGKISITKAGPCTYTYSKWKGTFAIPGLALIESSTTGKLNKKLSTTTCPATDIEEYSAGLMSASSEVLEAVLA